MKSCGPVLLNKKINVSNTRSKGGSKKPANITRKPVKKVATKAAQTNNDKTTKASTEPKTDNHFSSIVSPSTTTTTVSSVGRHHLKIPIITRTTFYGPCSKTKSLCASNKNSFFGKKSSSTNNITNVSLSQTKPLTAQNGTQTSLSNVTSSIGYVKTLNIPSVFIAPSSIVKTFIAPSQGILIPSEALKSVNSRSEVIPCIQNRLIVSHSENKVSLTDCSNTSDLKLIPSKSVVTIPSTQISNSDQILKISTHPQKKIKTQLIPKTILTPDKHRSQPAGKSNKISKVTNQSLKSAKITIRTRSYNVSKADPKSSMITHIPIKPSSPSNKLRKIDSISKKGQGAMSTDLNKGTRTTDSIKGPMVSIGTSPPSIIGPTLIIAGNTELAKSLHRKKISSKKDNPTPAISIITNGSSHPIKNSQTFKNRAVKTPPNSRSRINNKMLDGSSSGSLRCKSEPPSNHHEGKFIQGHHFQ